MVAQTKSAEGEYYLQGVMETASGFKLNADHSFEFFFSYGALDRQGAGTWKQEGETILFNSRDKHKQDFVLQQSTKQPAKGTTIQISGANAQVNKLVHAIVKNSGGEEQAAATADGQMHFNLARADSIILLFEWCPDKRSVFAIPDTANNFFEFSILPSLTDVVFDDFKLQLNDEGFTGAHPLDKAKSFRYKKAKAQ